MKVELSLNELDNNWWFELGISYGNTAFEYNKVLSIAFVFFTVYIRFDKIKNN